MGMIIIWIIKKILIMRGFCYKFKYNRLDKKMPSLIVIDMQKHFDTSKNRKLRLNIKNLIKKSIEKKENIVFVEYEDLGRTIPYLTNLTKEYDKVHFITKEDDDGSYEIIEYFRDNKIPFNKVTICGINKSACVFATVEGLSKRRKRAKIIVDIDACADGYDCDYFTEEDFKEIGPNVSLNHI